MKRHLVLFGCAVLCITGVLATHFARATSPTPVDLIVRARVDSLLQLTSATSGQAQTIHDKTEAALAAYDAQGAQSRAVLTMAGALFTTSAYDDTGTRSLVAQAETQADAIDETIAEALVAAHRELTSSQRRAVADQLRSMEPLSLQPSVCDVIPALESKLSTLNIGTSLTADQHRLLDERLSDLMRASIRDDTWLQRYFERAITLFDQDGDGEPLIAAYTSADRRSRHLLFETVVGDVAAIMNLLSTTDRAAVVAAFTSGNLSIGPSDLTGCACTSAPETDPDNCGWCGHACASGVCIQGSCLPASGGCIDESTCRAQFSGSACSPTSTGSGPVSGSSYSFDDVLATAPYPVETVLAKIQCLSALSQPEDRCLTYSAIAADLSGSDNCGLRSWGGFGDVTCSGVDFRNDADNCGWCGHICSSNEICVTGSCKVGTASLPTRYNMTASPYGDLFSVDLAGNAWVDTGGATSTGAWQNMGAPPGDTIRYGVVATQPTPGDQLRFALAVGASGSLWLLRYETNLNNQGYSGWEWQAHTPPTECGAIVDMVAYTEVFDQALTTLSRCSTGKLALLGTESWVIQDGPAGSGVVLDRTPAIAEGFDSASVPRGYAFVFDTTGAVWAASITHGTTSGSPATWTWDLAGTPSGVALLGEPSITYEGATGYAGGLFIGDDGQAWELAKSTSGWSWTPHGFPSTANCRVPDGKGFSMPIDASADGTHFGVVRCKGLNADNVNSVARLTYASGQWSWDVAQVPIPAGLTTSSTGLYLYGDPFAVNYNCPSAASRGEAFFMAYDTATQALIRMSWKSDPYDPTVPWQFINRESPDPNGPDPTPPCSSTPACVDLPATTVTAPCTDLMSCRHLYGGPGCNPPADFNSMTETSSLSFCDFVRLSGQTPAVLLPIMECLSGFDTSSTHCLTATDLMASINANNACGIGGGN